MKDKFDQIMALAKFGAMQRDESTARIFKMFVSYMTFLVGVAGFILVSFQNEKKIDSRLTFLLTLAGIIALICMSCVYQKWLKTTYGSAIYSLRRRDFYLKKAEIVCYHASKKLNGDFGTFEDVCVNLGSGFYRKTSEQRLIEKTKALDIENCIERNEDKNKSGEPWPPDDAQLSEDNYFLFNLWFPRILTGFNCIALSIMLISAFIDFWKW